MKMDIDKLLKNYKPDIDFIISDIKDEYIDELEDYEYVNDFSKVSLGGYLKYFNVDCKIVGSGAFVKDIGEFVLIKNISTFKLFRVSKCKYYFFYKCHSIDDESCFDRACIDNLLKNILNKKIK